MRSTHASTHSSEEVATAWGCGVFVHAAKRIHRAYRRRLAKLASAVEVIEYGAMKMLMDPERPSTVVRLLEPDGLLSQ